jgi:hypothetical protein
MIGLNLKHTESFSKLWLKNWRCCGRVGKSIWIEKDWDKKSSPIDKWLESKGTMKPQWFRVLGNWWCGCRRSFGRVGKSIWIANAWDKKLSPVEKWLARQNNLKPQCSRVFINTTGKFCVFCRHPRSCRIDSCLSMTVVPSGCFVARFWINLDCGQIWVAWVAPPN